MTKSELLNILHGTRCPCCDGWKGTIHPFCSRCWYSLPAEQRGALHAAPLDPQVNWRAMVCLGLRQSEVTPWIGRAVVGSGQQGKRPVVLDPRLAAQVVVGGPAAFEWCSVTLGGQNEQ